VDAKATLETLVHTLPSGIGIEPRHHLVGHDRKGVRVVNWGTSGLILLLSNTRL
jgi:hypothetical protein